MTRRYNFGILGLPYYRSTLWLVTITEIVLLVLGEVNAEMAVDGLNFTEYGHKG